MSATRRAEILIVDDEANTLASLGASLSHRRS
jgi:hypothetical protein